MPNPKLYKLDGQRVFVIGGNGFIGRHVVRALVGFGCEVRIMDISPIPTKLSGVECVTGMVGDTALLAAAVSGYDTVIFLANSSLPGSSNADLSSEVDNHVRSTVKAAEVCSSQGVKRFIFASSGGTVYGYTADHPLKEDMPTMPTNAYGASKLAIEHYLRILRTERPMDTISLRISNPYGEEQRALRNQGFIAAAIEHAIKRKPLTIWGDGKTERDFVHVSDVAQAFAITCVEKNLPDAINIGSGNATSLLEVLEIMEFALGYEVPIISEPGRKIDVDRNVLDCSRAKEFLSWSAEIQLRDGIERTAKWWQAN